MSGSHLRLKAPLVLLMVTFVFLALRAQQEHHWSEWAFADAQTLSAVQHYKNDGFLPLYFLWTPQYYVTFARLFDEPELNHHAVGTVTGTRNNRMYTHYPSWYSIPIAVMAKLGIYGKIPYQIWGSFVSLCALFLFYLILINYFSPSLSFAMLALYVISPTFLSYSDSLSTMPYDLFFRYLFVWLWIRWNPRPWSGHFWTVLFVYLLSCLSAVESYAFIPIFVFMQDKLIWRTPVAWKRLLILFVAPAIALFVQFVQNTLYIGKEETLRDWNRILSILSHPSADSTLNLSQTLLGYYRALASPIEKAFYTSGPFIALFLIMSFYLLYKERRKDLMALLVLALPGYGFCLAFPKKAVVDYQALQIIPLMLGLYVLVGLILKARWHQFRELSSSKKVQTAVLSALFLLMAGMTFGKGVMRRIDIPAKNRADLAFVEFFKDVQNKLPGQRVYFQVGEIIPELHGAFANQVDPMYEYYAQSIVLGFKDAAQVPKDIDVIVGRGYKDFSSVFLVRDEGDLKIVHDTLQRFDMESIDEGAAPNGSRYVLAKFR